MRAFFAVEIPDAVRDALADLGRQLQHAPVRVSWVKPGNLHVTLRFLGDVGAPDVDRLGERLAPQYARTAPFTVEIAGAGAFPNAHTPVVLWVGVQDASGELAVLHAKAEEAAEYIGIEPERRPFRGHITLGRVRDARRAGELTPLLRAAAPFAGGRFTVEAVALMESRLHPGGSIYTLVRRFPLAGEEK